MVDDAEFKRFRRKVQGKYYKKTFVDNIVLYSYIVKVDKHSRFDEDLSNCITIISKSIILNGDWVMQKEEEHEYALFMSMFNLEFGERIRPQEYKKALKVYDKR